MSEKKWPNVPPETKMKGERKRAEYGTGEDVERRHDWEREHDGRSRPHIAPCSCELHQALREALERNAKLEAELSDERQFIWMAKKEIEELRMWRGEAEVQRARVRKALVDQTVSMNGSAQWQARAEKAEADAVTISKDRNRWQDRASVAEARVAFLEKDWENRHAARVRELVACQARVAALEAGERFTERQFRVLEKAGWRLAEAAPAIEERERKAN